MAKIGDSSLQSAGGPLDPRAITTAEVTERLSRRLRRLLAVVGPELTSDIDRMHGWLPRLGETEPPGSIDLVALRAELAQTLEAIDALLSRSEVPDSPPSSGAGRPPRSRDRRR